VAVQGRIASMSATEEGIERRGGSDDHLVEVQQVADCPSQSLAPEPSLCRCRI